MVTTLYTSSRNMDKTLYTLVYSKVYCNIIMVILLMVMVMGFASATGTLANIKLGQNITITQGCVGSTYSNISQITLDGKLINSSQLAMTKSGISYSYNYKPTSVGYYQVMTHCDELGVDTPAPLDFTVSLSGYANNGSTNTFFVLMVVLIYSISFIGFFAKNEWVCILGGMGMIAMGLYTINSGVIVFSDALTKVFSWTTIGLGAMFSLVAGISIIEENL